MITEKSFEGLIQKCREADPLHHIDNIYCQLNPNAWLRMLYNTLDDSWDRDTHYVLDGVYHGFCVIDSHSDIPSYAVPNYRSCFSKQAYEKVTSTLQQELSNGKLSISKVTPHSIHALGAISKSTSDYRIITDCSKPD